MIWILFAVLFLLALFFCLAGLKPRPESPDRTASDLAIYRRQLDELQADYERGLIGEAERAAAHVEISRRILVAGSAASERSVKRAAPIKTMVVIGGILGLVSLVYLQLGRPELPGSPAQKPQVPAVSADGQPNMTALLDELEARMSENPDRLDGWVLLGRTALRAGQADRAARAFKRATALQDDNAEFHAGLGEALVRLADGQVTPAAELAFRHAIERDGQNPTANFFMGLFHAQNNRPEKALAIWQALAARAPDNAPWLAGLRTQIARMKSRLSRSEMAQPGSRIANRSLSADDLAAAAQMSPDERRAMITAMVERLAARLENNPDDFESWLRLSNAYKILGDETSAKNALMKARAVAPAERIEEIDRHLHMLKE